MQRYARLANEASPWFKIQEAQLLQRDHTTLRVIEYFAKSLKITQQGVYRFNWTNFQEISRIFQEGF